jgi:hypothetical protein
MRWAMYVARTEDGRGAYRNLMGRLEGKIPLGKPSWRWMKLACIFTYWNRKHGLDALAQVTDRWRALVHAVMNRVP